MRGFRPLLLAGHLVAISIVTRPLTQAATDYSANLPAGASRGSTVLRLPTDPNAANYFKQCVKDRIYFPNSSFSIGTGKTSTNLNRTLGRGKRNNNNQDAEAQCGLVGPACPSLNGLEGKDYSKCDLFGSTNLKAEEAEIKALVDASSCRDDRFKKIQDEYNCLKKDNAKLTEYLGGLKGAFQGEIQRFQKEQSQMDKELGDLKNQQLMIRQKLGGNKDTAERGLLQMKAELEAILSEGGGGSDSDSSSGSSSNSNRSGSIRGYMEEATDAIQIARKNIQNVVMEQAMAQANTCFSAVARANMTAIRNGGPVSPRDHLLAVVRESFLPKKNGVPDERPSQALTAANQKTAKLLSILNQIIAYSPRDVDFATSNPDIGSDPQKLAAFMSSQKTRIMNPKQIEALFGSQLSGIGSSFDVKNFVLREYNRCYKESYAALENERIAAQNDQTSSNRFTPLYRQLKASERDFIRRSEDIVDKMINSYVSTTEVFCKNSQAGCQDLRNRLNPQNCSVSIQQQMACYSSLRTGVQNFLRGRGPTARMNIVIPASSNPKLNFQKGCDGVDGCISAMQGWITDFDKGIQAYESYKMNYQKQAMQSMQKFITDLAGPQGLSQSAKIMQERLDAINCTLNYMSDGQSSGVSFEPYSLGRGGALQVGPDGLPEVPTDLVALVGAQTSPPLRDMSGGGQDALRGMQTALASEKSKVQKVAKLKQDFATWDKRCADEYVSQVIENSGLKKHIDSSGVCSKFQQVCMGKQDALSELADSISELFDLSSTKGTAQSLSGLDCNSPTGSSAACTPPGGISGVNSSSNYSAEVTRIEESIRSQEKTLQDKADALQQAFIASSTDKSKEVLFNKSYDELRQFREQKATYQTCVTQERTELQRCTAETDSVKRSAKLATRQFRNKKASQGR